MKYTIRNIPDALDAAMRERAMAEGKTLDQVVREALARAAGPPRRDLSDLVGSWREDAEFDQAVAEQHDPADL